MNNGLTLNYKSNLLLNSFITEEYGEELKNIYKYIKSNPINILNIFEDNSYKFYTYTIKYKHYLNLENCIRAIYYKSSSNMNRNTSTKIEDKIYGKDGILNFYSAARFYIQKNKDLLAPNKTITYNNFSFGDLYNYFFFRNNIYTFYSGTGLSSIQTATLDFSNSNKEVNYDEIDIQSNFYKKYNINKPYVSRTSINEYKEYLMTFIYFGGDSSFNETINKINEVSDDNYYIENILQKKLAKNKAHIKILNPTTNIYDRNHINKFKILCPHEHGLTTNVANYIIDVMKYKIGYVKQNDYKFKVLTPLMVKVFHLEEFLYPVHQYKIADNFKSNVHNVYFKKINFVKNTSPIGFSLMNPEATVNRPNESIPNGLSSNASISDFFTKEKKDDSTEQPSSNPQPPNSTSTDDLPTDEASESNNMPPTNEFPKTNNISPTDSKSNDIPLTDESDDDLPTDDFPNQKKDYPLPRIKINPPNNSNKPPRSRSNSASPTNNNPKSRRDIKPNINNRPIKSVPSKPSPSKSNPSCCKSYSRFQYTSAIKRNPGLNSLMLVIKSFQ